MATTARFLHLSRLPRHATDLGPHQPRRMAQHRTARIRAAPLPELTALAAADRWLRRAGEGTHILWALDIVAAHYWVDNDRTALAVTELVCIGPELAPELLANLDRALDAAGWRPTPGAEPNSACIINHTPCHYSAWNDAISTPQYQGPAQQGHPR